MGRKTDCIKPERAQSRCSARLVSFWGRAAVRRIEAQSSERKISRAFFCVIFSLEDRPDVRRDGIGRKWNKDVFINGGDEKLFFNIFATTCASN